MIRKATELFLIAIVVIGGVLAWRSGRERARLGVEYARLSHAVGDLTITDPAKIHILAIDTGEPLHYAWRVYLPPHTNRMLRGGSVSRTLISASQPQEFVVRIRIRQSAEKSRLQIYEQIEFGRSVNDLGDERLAAIVRGHEREILVEQLGTGGVAVLDPSQSAVLLRLVMSEGMQSKARQALDPEDIPRFLPDLLRYELSPQPPEPRPPSPGR
jgi:hypothetical protein